MALTSVHFTIFFITTALLYFLLPQRWRWKLLLVASYYFYMCSKPAHAVMMLATWVTYSLVSTSRHPLPCIAQASPVNQNAIISYDFVSHLSVEPLDVFPAGFHDPALRVCDVGFSLLLLGADCTGALGLVTNLFTCT